MMIGYNVNCMLPLPCNNNNYSAVVFVLKSQLLHCHTNKTNRHMRIVLGRVTVSTIKQLCGNVQR